MEMSHPSPPRFADPIRPTVLRSLNLNGCVALGDGAVRFLVEACPLLEVVHLCGCGRLTDDAPRALLESCARLADVRLASCGRVFGDFLSNDHVAARNERHIEGEVACLTIRPSVRVLDLGGTAARRETARWVATACPDSGRAIQRRFNVGLLEAMVERNVLGSPPER